MRRLAVVLALTACGGRSSPARTPAPVPPAVLDLQWGAVDGTDGPGNAVDVTLIIEGKPVSVGVLDGASDADPSGAASCSIVGSSTVDSSTRCGDTPEYQGFVVTLSGGQLVLSLQSGVDDLSTTEVKRIPEPGATAIRVKAEIAH